MAGTKQTSTGPGEDPRRAVARRLRELRTSRGLSQEALADAAGMDRTYVSGLERGLRNATVLSIWKLALALGVEPGELLRVK